MGSCISSATATVGDRQQPTARVVTASGSMREYSAPTTVSAVLHDEPAAGSRSSFLCNSDDLRYDEYVPEMRLGGPVVLPGQLYFVLPKEMLRSRLSGADMAALAVRASSALLEAASAGKGKGGNKMVRIMPVVEEESCCGSTEEDDNVVDEGFRRKKAPGGRGRMGSKLPLTSYRPMLIAIQEVAD